MVFIILFIESFILSIILVPIIKKIGIKFKLFDHIDKKRKKNYEEKVRIGGLGAFLSIFFSISIFYLLKQFNLYSFDFELNYFLIFAITFYFFLGLLEDIIGITFFKRLLMQTIFGIFIWKFGCKVETINILYPLSNNLIFELNNFSSLIFSILWFAGIVNAINWIDGLDGLAAGQSIIMLLALSFVSLGNNFINESIIGIIIAGSFLGFLRYNWYPSSILMGDGGSYLLGSSIAFMSLISTSPNINQSDFFPISSNISLLVIFPILFIPLTDMILVILKRILSGSSIFYPDRKHFHYFLLDKGLSHNYTVWINISFSLFFTSIGLAFYVKNFFIIMIPAIIIIYQLYKINQKN